MNTLLIVDGNNIAHRARYKFQLDNNGVDVSVTYGFLRMLLSYIRNYNATSCIVCWDGGIPVFRRERVPSYKANRSHGVEDPIAYDEFLRQLHELRDDILPLMGVLSVWRRYIEADDLAYHAVAMAQDNYDKIIVASNDKDLYQCLNNTNTFILDPAKNAIRDVEWVEAEYGIDFTQYAHWRALQGDSSDNIAGVPGIGPVTATKLFAEHKYISNIFNAAKERKLGKLSDKILDFGWDALVNNIYVMVLAFDRAGSRKVLSDSAFLWQKADTKRMKVYFMRNAFISLMDPLTYKLASGLEQPQLDDSLRMPIVYGYRKEMT